MTTITKHFIQQAIWLQKPCVPHTCTNRWALVLLHCNTIQYLHTYMAMATDVLSKDETPCIHTTIPHAHHVHPYNIHTCSELASGIIIMVNQYRFIAQW